MKKRQEKEPRKSIELRLRSKLDIGENHEFTHFLAKLQEAASRMGDEALRIELTESKRLLHLTGRRLGKLGLKIGKLASENERMRKILNRYEALDIELDLTRVVPAGWFDRFRAAGTLRKKERRTHCPCNHDEPSECHSKDGHARFETRKKADEESKGLPYDRPRWPAKKARS